MTGDTCSPGQDFEEAACTGPTCGMFILCYLNATKQWLVIATTKNLQEKQRNKPHRKHLQRD